MNRNQRNPVTYTSLGDLPILESRVRRQNLHGYAGDHYLARSTYLMDDRILASAHATALRLRDEAQELCDSITEAQLAQGSERRAVIHRIVGESIDVRHFFDQLLVQTGLNNRVLKWIRAAKFAAPRDENDRRDKVKEDYAMQLAAGLEPSDAPVCSKLPWKAICEQAIADEQPNYPVGHPFRR